MNNSAISDGGNIMAARADGSHHNHFNSSIEQIRDIIFGDQIIEFEKQINGLKQECDDLKRRVAELETKHTKTDQTLSANFEKSKSDQQQVYELIEQLKKEIDHKIEQLAESKVDKNQIGQAFIEWGIKVKQEATH